ncbi:mitochondrial E3 ubiquitin protein ligase 1-like [Onthophagus taurus]|uniref:mitochondrial E3 ubiquitin protein ligase 1-like n=1 Tax=Onthophagus taurus TaxID=166361 RepID=UPI000C209334|nr:mitochondrial E3 ubiquitin protein ligase 1-like [Onthophagus taurus]
MDFPLETIILAVDAMVFAACFLAYYKKKTIINQIENAPQLGITNDLKNVVMDYPGYRIPYACIQGVVKPIGVPIISNSNPKVNGVVQYIILREHIAQLTEGHWSDRQRIIRKIRNVVPFTISNSEQSVKILAPLSAAMLDMDIISDTYSGNAQEVISHAWSHILGVKQTGIQTTEKMLKSGTILTAIGELSLSPDRKQVFVTPPSNGAPYFLTFMEVSSLLAKLKRSKFTYGIVCAVCFALGLYLCVRFQKKKKDTDFRLVE